MGVAMVKTSIWSTMTMKQQFIYILTIVGVCCLILGVVICTIISGIMDKRESLEPSEVLEPTIELCGVATIGDSPPQPVRIVSQPGTPIVIRSEKPINMILKRCSESTPEK